MAKKTATGTGTGVEAKVKEAPKVHTGLLKLLQREDAANEQAASVLVEIAELVARDNISNPVLVKTLMEARGIQESSAKSQASRYRAVMKNKDMFQALKEGRVTVRAAVKSSQASRPPTKESNQKRFDGALSKLVEAAKALGQDLKTLLTTIESEFEKAGIK